MSEKERRGLNCTLYNPHHLECDFTLNPVSVKRQKMSILYKELLVKPRFVSPGGDETKTARILEFRSNP